MNSTVKALNLNEAKEETLNRRVDERIGLLESESGKKATSAQVQEIVDRLVIDGEIEGKWFNDPDRRFFEVKDGEKFFISDVDSIPENDLVNLKESFKRQYGSEPTEEEIILNYNEFIMKKRKKQ